MPKLISFVTRVHPRRKTYLEFCKDSVARQTCRDYEHVFIYDKTEKGCGFPQAQKMLAKAAINTKYAMPLDDDDVLIYPDFVADLRMITQLGNYDLIIFKGHHIGHGVLPLNSLWKKPPECGGICSFCVAVKKELWDKYIHVWGNRWPCGDFDFIDTVYKNSKSVYWFDKIVAKTLRISRGKAEDED